MERNGSIRALFVLSLLGELAAASTQQVSPRSAGSSSKDGDEYDAIDAVVLVER